MTDETMDPFDRLRALNPVDSAELAGAASSAQAVETLEGILGGRRRPRGATRRRVGVLVLVPVAVLLLAAVAWALTHGATKHIGVGCYAGDDLRARTVVVPATRASPVAACAAAWKRGDLGARATPSLQACVLPSGGIGVFPSPDGSACRRLHLVALRPAPPSPVVPLRAALVRAFLASPCLSRDDAAAAARSELNRLGLAGWRVGGPDAFPASRPCASFAVDEAGNAVLLVPVPRRG